jgi:hypothetical protein
MNPLPSKYGNAEQDAIGGLSSNWFCFMRGVVCNFEPTQKMCQINVNI